MRQRVNRFPALGDLSLELCDLSLQPLVRCLDSQDASIGLCDDQLLEREWIAEFDDFGVEDELVEVALEMAK